MYMKWINNRIMLRIYLLLLSLIVLNIQSSCSKSSENAIKELGNKNISYNKETFVEIAQRCDVEIIELFLTAGMDPNVKNRYGNTALISAASKGSAEVIRKLINADADVNSKNKNGDTPLLVAAKHSRLDIIELLVNAH